jgi:hypothetical protein
MPAVWPVIVENKIEMNYARKGFEMDPGATSGEYNYNANAPLSWKVF